MSTEAAQETVAVAMTATSPPHTRQLSATCAAVKRETATVAVSMATTTPAECCDKDCRAAVVAGTMVPAVVDRGSTASSSSSSGGGSGDDVDHDDSIGRVL